MEEDFLEQYFDDVATAVKPISHTEQIPAYYRIKDKYDLEEFDNAVRNMKKNCCLLLEMGGGMFSGWDTPGDSVRIGLHVLIKATELFADIKAARATAKQILIMIIALMRKDCEEFGLYADNAEGPLKAKNVVFDSSGKYDNVAVPEGNWYGKCIYIDFKTTVDMSYKPENYN